MERMGPYHWNMMPLVALDIHLAKAYSSIGQWMPERQYIPVSSGMLIRNRDLSVGTKRTLSCISPLSCNYFFHLWRLDWIEPSQEGGSVAMSKYKCIFKMAAASSVFHGWNYGWFIRWAKLVILLWIDTTLVTDCIFIMISSFILPCVCILWR